MEPKGPKLIGVLKILESAAVTEMKGIEGANREKVIKGSVRVVKHPLNRNKTR